MAKNDVGETSPRASKRNEALALVARQAVDRAEEAYEAACAAVKAHNEEASLSKLRTMTLRTLEGARGVLMAIEAGPRHGERQSSVEFFTMLGDEVREAVENHVDEVVLYSQRRFRQARSLIEDHFNIDEGFRMLGPLHQDANLARDVHDWFNLIALIPVVVLNFANWQLPMRWPESVWNAVEEMPALWHGWIWSQFWWTTFWYFVADLMWMLLVPNCVKSPGLIIKHHIATLAYILIPKSLPQYGWLMGACMSVEVNTWFLIARRTFNKRGDRPFSIGVTPAKSARLMIVSICFYISWFVIRLGVYPFLLVVIINEWMLYSKLVGTPLNTIIVCVVLQCVFIYLNVKWTLDLLRSKMKGRGPAKGL